MRESRGGGWGPRGGTRQKQGKLVGACALLSEVTCRFSLSLSTQLLLLPLLPSPLSRGRTFGNVAHSIYDKCPLYCGKAKPLSLIWSWRRSLGLIGGFSGGSSFLSFAFQRTTPPMTTDSKLMPPFSSPMLIHVS